MHRLRARPQRRRLLRAALEAGRCAAGWCCGAGAAGGGHVPAVAEQVVAGPVAPVRVRP